MNDHPKGGGATVFEIAVVVALLVVACLILFPRHEAQAPVNRGGSPAERGSPVIVGPIEGGDIE